MHFKRKLAITATALAAVAFAGGAYAATQDSPGRERQAFLNDVAKRLNVTPQALTAALKGAYIDQLNAAVKAGKLTQAEANALAQRVQNGGPGPFWFGAPGPGGRPLFGRPGPAGRHGPLGAAASYLGLTPAQLSSQLRSGKTLAQIATARGKSASGLQQAMMASIKSRLDQAVNAKRISKAQEQQILNMLSTHLSNEINGKRPGGGAPGFFGHPGFFRHLNRGPGGAAGGAGGPGGPGGGAPGGPGGGVPGAPGGPGGGASGAPAGPGGGVPGALFEAPPPPPSA